MNLTTETKDQIANRLLNTYALCVVLLYWLAVALILIYKLLKPVTLLGWDFVTTWLSDQMGYTTGFFIETVQLAESTGTINQSEYRCFIPVVLAAESTTINRKPYIRTTGLI